MNNPKITSVGIAAALLLFSALLFGQRAEASWMNGQQLGTYCGTDDDVFSIALCSGYLMGVIDKLDRDHIALTGRPPLQGRSILTHRRSRCVIWRAIYLSHAARTTLSPMQ